MLFFFAFLGGLTSIIFLSVTIGALLEKQWRITPIFFILCAISCFVCIFSISKGTSINKKVVATVETETLVTAEYELLPMYANIENSGNDSKYYLHIDTDHVYSFIYKITKEFKDGFRPDEIVSDNISLNETNTHIPMIIESTTYTRYKVSKSEKFWGAGFVPFDSETKSYVIYVPDGTIYYDLSPDF